MGALAKSITLFLLNWLDAQLTLFWVHSHIATEGNGLMAQLLRAGDAPFLLTKLALGGVRRGRSLCPLSLFASGGGAAWNAISAGCLRCSHVRSSGHGTLCHRLFPAARDGDFCWQSSSYSRFTLFLTQSPILAWPIEKPRLFAELWPP